MKESEIFRREVKSYDAVNQDVGGEGGGGGGGGD